METHPPTGILRNRAFARVLAAALVLGLPVAAFPEASLPGGRAFRFASAEEGRKILGTPDLFSKRMSAFDRRALARREGDVSEAEALSELRSRVLEWTDEERARLAPFVEEAAKLAAFVQVPLPDEVLLVKTKDLVPYTRHNVIVLPARGIASAGDGFVKLLLHELFHVLSRHNPDLHQKLYSIAGFVVDDSVTIPDSLDSLRITNPDAPLLNVRIQFSIGGEPTWVVPVTHSLDGFKAGDARPYPMGYMAIGWLELEDKDGRYVGVMKDGKPLLHPVPAATDLMQKTGGNTGYIIHPEEILADVFAIAAMGSPAQNRQQVRMLRRALAPGPRAGENANGNMKVEP